MNDMLNGAERTRVNHLNQRAHALVKRFCTGNALHCALAALGRMFRRAALGRIDDTAGKNQVALRLKALRACKLAKQRDHLTREMRLRPIKINTGNIKAEQLDPLGIIGKQGGECVLGECGDLGPKCGHGGSFLIDDLTRVQHTRTRAIMADTQIIDRTEPANTTPKSEMRDFGDFMVKLVIAMFILRSFLFAPFNIPSESMMPRVLVGDYLIVTKWPYGFSRHSFPFSLPLIQGRVLSTLPVRGDVVVFKTPQDNRTDFIKRVIGLPGDTVQMVGGQLVLNGQPVAKQRLDDWVGTPTPGQPCLSVSESLCHFPRYRETLPGGRSYDVLDLRDQGSDNTEVFKVPVGQLFLMGDNRDNSEDSRFTTAENGIGLVPMENLVGRAQFMFFSWDANGDWAHKIRWGRIGSQF